MERITPKRKSTETSPDFRQWAPSSFSNFFTELDHIIAACRNPFSMPLFRGHVNHEWVPDSAFVRNCIKILFEVYRHHLLSEEIRRSVAFHNAVVALLLTKFGHLYNPDIDEAGGGHRRRSDPWHEIMVDFQRHPLKDTLLPGSFLFEMSSSKDVGLYFATYEGKGRGHEIGSQDGALCICDPVETETSLTRQIKTVDNLLDLIALPDFLDGDRTFPVLYQPPEEVIAESGLNSSTVYLAQLDFRFNLADIWADYEEKYGQRIFVSLLLNEGIKKGVANYLETSGLAEEIASQLPGVDERAPNPYEDLSIPDVSVPQPEIAGQDMVYGPGPASGLVGLIQRGCRHTRPRHRTSSSQRSADAEFRFWPG